MSLSEKRGSLCDSKACINIMSNTQFVSQNEIANNVPAAEQLKSAGPVRFEGDGEGYRILFIGNSITLHGRKPDIGWYGDYGMAASSKERDYVHVFARMAEQKCGKVSFCIAQLAAWERDHTSATILEERYAAARAFDADLIIVRIGENMPKGSAPDSRPYFDAMIRFFKQRPEQRVIITDSFWRNDARDEMIREIAAENGYEFCHIGDLENDPTSMALGQFEHRGVSRHPSDLGMERIASRLFDML